MPGIAGMAYVLLAKVSLTRGELPEAEFVVRRAIDLLEGTTAAPYRADALETLADVAEQQEDNSGALAALREAAEIRKGSVLTRSSSARHER
jgi:tetratricopeptide (TPR) repeat protein